MKIYLVGGAVRDKLLGLPVKDNDWVVTGTTPQRMKRLGYRPVGKDFPVFLHPDTNEEYALARTERKSGHGYAGFVFHTAADVSIEEDLIRRDLTINAIAEDEQGNLIDPYQGQKDIQQQQLRHVSPAFQEDPLRILRVARFAARFHSLGFTVANETMELMKSMVTSGEASHLVAERVWQETVRALMEPAPDIYFKILEECGALSVVLPEIHTFIHNSDNLNNLQAAANHQASDVVRFGCLFAGDVESLPVVQAMSGRMRLPAAFTEMAALVVQYGATVPDILPTRNAEAWMRLYEQTDAIRRPERFKDLLTCISFINSEKNTKKVTEPLFKQCINHLHDLLAINARDIVTQGIKGREVGDRLRAERLEKLKCLLSMVGFHPKDR